ncbi:Fumarate hydratase class I, anaerobic [Thiorhodovibrio winogradskyi]|uniref:Fumarate hydratase class I n=1 Tax=Thiorhodovibrio winogradskyi TaxID=77007 RepID=A0ABZ0S8E2_9GAMM|nr:fumarate hydratase [Thiorhodovibrio winogradskyi]
MPQAHTATEIRADDLITSVADALQYISYYHPPDYLHALHQAYLREDSPQAKDAMAQLLVNSRLCALGQRPICQDTGMVVVMVKVGMRVRWDRDVSLQALIDEGVRRAYQHPDNPLRASMVSPPIGQRKNTGDNTPAVVHVELVPGDTVDVRLAAKGGGSENKARFAILNPSDSLVDWVLETVPKLGAGWCPPGMLGIGIGGSAEKAMLLAKEALLEDIDLHELRERGPANDIERLRLELYEKINALGIGAQGLGGLTTVLDVKIRTFPTHAASLPVALIPNCAATRHLHFTLDGSGPANFQPPRLEDWPAIDWDPSAGARRVDLDTITRDQVRQWRAGERLLLSGRVLTGRDAAHKRMLELLERGEPLPPGVDLTDRFIYYVGPVDPVRDEVVGPAGPTTSTRMDKFTPRLLARTGLLGMIGKAERGPTAIAAIKEHGAVYLMAVGGAAYLVAKAIRHSRLVAFEDLGMEAMREFELKDMPVIVAVDSGGEAIHKSGPRAWQAHIAGVPVRVEGA